MNKLFEEELNEILLSNEELKEIEMLEDKVAGGMAGNSSGACQCYN